MKTFSKTPGLEDVLPIACPCCGSSIDKHSGYYSYENYSYVRCSICSLVFQNPQPVSGDLSKRYDDEYFRYEIQNENSFLSLMLKGLDDIKFDTLDFTKTGKRMLDIGCATGRLLYEFKLKNWDVTGVEICREAALYGMEKRDLRIHTSPLEEISFPDNSFTFIHASHLIEHLNDPGKFLDEVYRILTPEGYFAVVTPNIAGFQARLFGDKWRSAIPDHMFLFSVKTLKKMSENSGFKFVRIRTWGGLAEGSAPLFIKKSADRLVKLTGSGDVMIFLFTKE